MATRREPIPIGDGPADSAQIAEFEHDRRDLIRRGLGLGGAVVAAASIPLLLSVRNAFAAVSGDTEILGTAIHLEQVAALGYDAAIAGGLLGAELERVALRFRAHEQAHAAALTTALTDLGGTPPPRATAKDVDAVAAGLGDARTRADVATFAIELELAAVAAYYDAHSRLVDAKLLQTGASIMANEAQHLVVLRQAARQDPVPNAFEIGKR